MDRESILQAIKANKPGFINLPEINLELFNEDTNVVETFISNLQMVGGRVVELNAIGDLDAEIRKQYPDANKIVSCYETSHLPTVTISIDTPPHTLETIDLALLNAPLGVAENGAVWISEADFIVRALPFITKDLVLILSRKDICRHLHEAYHIISNRNKSFGLFLSGPSKTADIEQCLVIGAQGAMSLTVFLV